MTDKQEFIKSLRDLLQKYNVGISVGFGECSDLYGVYDKHLQLIDTKTWQSFFRVDQWDMTYRDLEEDENDTE